MEGGPPEPIVSMRSSMLSLAISDSTESESQSGTGSDFEFVEEKKTQSEVDMNEKMSSAEWECDTGIDLGTSVDLRDLMKEKESATSLMQAEKGPNSPSLREKKSLNEKKDRKHKSKHHRQQDPPCREPPKDGVSWPKRDFLSFTRSLVFYGYGSITKEHETAAQYIQEARKMRKKYFGSLHTVVNDELLSHILNGNRDGDESLLTYRFGPDGTLQLFSKSNGNCSDPLIAVPTIDSFIKDYERLVEITSSGSMRTFSFQRLQMLTQAFKMHITANGAVENEAQSNLLGTDFYRTMKVDNHIHLAAAPSAKQFVSFVRNKLMNEGDTVVLEDGKTLRQVFTEAGLDLDHLTIDAFNVLADYSVYQRFDNFNSKYSPFRMAQMRKIFLKTSNCMEGRYFAELTKIVLARHEASKGHNSAAEMRLSIYGMERDEWLHLAKWVLTNWGVSEGDENLYSPGPVLSTHNRWLIQVPRLWRIYHAKGGKDGKPERSFQNMLVNLFIPIVEATLDPQKHPEVAELLTHIVGFDSVDDEGTLEEPCSCTRPSKWNQGKNPAYCWQLYFLWANIEIINKLREAKGLNTFAFRPHAGETGNVMHLAASYMLCTSINHGVNLENQVSLQYLYYLDQVSIRLPSILFHYDSSRYQHVSLFYEIKLNKCNYLCGTF